MTREETKELLMMIQAAYPNYKPQDKTVTINTWQMALEDQDWGIMQLAFKTFLRTDTSGFAPSPGQLIDRAYRITAPEELSESDAWILVMDALSNGAYNAEAEFDRLPPMVQKAVGAPSQLYNWATDENFNEGVARSLFSRSYRSVAERQEESAKLPESVRKEVIRLIDNVRKAKE